MAENERTSPELAALAARALANPERITMDELRQLAACVLTQAPDQPEPEQPERPELEGAPV